MICIVGVNDMLDGFNDCIRKRVQFIHFLVDRKHGFVCLYVKLMPARKQRL